MDVSIIIVNYNTRQMTEECINSIFQKTTGIDFEVILVDNASTDGSQEHFSHRKDITYIYSEENLGFGRANNLGYRYATGRHVFLLNSDTLLLNNAVSLLSHYLDSNQAQQDKVGCVGCQLVDSNNKPTWSGGTFPSIGMFWQHIMQYTFWELYHPTQETKPYNQITDVDYITGADLLIRREVIEECGLFDADFFMYYEETEMQFRYNRAGFRRRIIIEPKIKHLVGGSYKRQGHSLRGIIRSLPSRYIYCRKTMPIWKNYLVALIHLLMIPRTLICRAPWQEKKELITLIYKNIF